MNNHKILIDHGSGGRLSNQLICDTIIPYFNNPMLSKLDDGAVFQIQNTKFAFSTDSYVVDPIFFPGGSIGDLAINGTVNDIAMCGANPLFISIGLIIEEGFDLTDLNQILKNMNEAAKKADVTVVTGDTKVVPKGAADKIFINTSGLGTVYENIEVSSCNAKPGDQIILSGHIADHGIAVLCKREGLSFHSNISSDTAPLNHIVKQMVAISKNIHVLRDPTRGGVGTALNEIAFKSNVGIKIFEKQIPIKKETTSVCDLLGFDPLYIANEGKLIAFVDQKDAFKLLETIKQYNQHASIIGQVIDDHPGSVVMETRIGGLRIIDMLSGEQLPRIC